MSKYKYKIEKKNFIIIYDKLQNVISSFNVLECYCKQNKYSDDICNIYPILEYAYKELDSVFLYFINKRYAEKNEKITFIM